MNNQWLWNLQEWTASEMAGRAWTKVSCCPLCLSWAKYLHQSVSCLSVLCLNNQCWTHTNFSTYCRVNRPASCSKLGPWLNSWTGDGKFRTGEEWQPRLNSRSWDREVQEWRGSAGLTEHLNPWHGSSGLERSESSGWTTGAEIGKFRTWKEWQVDGKTSWEGKHQAWRGARTQRLKQEWPL